MNEILGEEIIARSLKDFSILFNLNLFCMEGGNLLRVLYREEIERLNFVVNDSYLFCTSDSRAE